MAVTLLFYAAYFSWITFPYDEMKVGSAVAKLGGIGILLGVSHLFKPISILYIAAVAFACLVINGAFRLRRSGRITIAICLILLSFMGSRTIGQAVLNLAVKPEHRNLPMVLSDGLVKGLNVSSAGEFDPVLAKKLSQMDAKGEWKYLKEAIARDYREYPLLFVKKFFRLYGWPGHYLYKYALALRAGGSRMPHILIRLIKGEHVFFRIVFCIGAFGFLLTVFRRRTGGYILPGLTAILLIMVFTTLLMAFESAVRYKTSIYPFYFVMLVYCREFGPGFRKICERRLPISIRCGGRPLVVVSVAFAFCALVMAFSLGYGTHDMNTRRNANDLVVPAADCDINFAPVAVKLLSGCRYRFGCENIIVEKGAVDYIDVRLYDSVTKRNCSGCMLKVDVLSHATGPQQWSFVTPDRPGDYQIRIHAGHIGHSRGIGLRCMNANVSLETNHRSNTNVLVVPAADREVNFVLGAGKLSSGYKYRFDCEDVVVEKGAVDYIDVRLYDCLTKRNCAGCALRVDALSHATGPQKWFFVTPDQPGDYQVRIHAGHIGHSRGIGLRCINVSVSPIEPLD